MLEINKTEDWAFFFFFVGGNMMIFNAIIGFKKLAKLTKKDPKSLMRMLSPSGNPTASNLFDVICALEKKENVHYELHAVR